MGEGGIKVMASYLSAYSKQADVVRTENFVTAAMKDES